MTGLNYEEGQWGFLGHLLDSHRLEFEAKMAHDFIERWGMVLAMDDGEDSAGRHKIRLATPEELVSRAFTIAELFMKEARRRNLVHDSDKQKGKE